MPAKKYTQQGKLVEVLDNVLTYGSIGKAATASEVDPWTIGRWRRMSEEGHSDFQAIDYRGLTQPFHSHFEDCIEHSIDEIESNFRASARDGYWRPLIWHGDYCYERDDEVIAMDQETRDMLGITDEFKWILDPTTGKKVRKKIMIWEPPSIDAQVKVLSSWSDRYADKRNLKVDMNVERSLGVTVVREGLGLPPPRAQLEVIESVAENVTEESASEAVYSEITPEDVLSSETCNTQNTLSQDHRDILTRLHSRRPTSGTSERLGDDLTGGKVT